MLESRRRRGEMGFVGCVRGCGAACVAAALLAGCAGRGGGGASGPSSDPMARINDKELNTSARASAVDELWASVERGEVDRALGREALKKLVWARGAPGNVRLRAVEHLFADTSEAGTADNRRLLLLSLPTETDWEVIGLMARTSAERGWTDVAPGLVRSYARRVPEPVDAERVERGALLAMFPGKPIEEIVFDVFLNTPSATAEGDPGLSVAGVSSADAGERVRNDAWALLGRLDPDGGQRARLLATAPEGTAADATLALLRRAATELGVVPVTGSELAWLRGLAAEKDPANAAWWTEARAAVAALGAEQRQGLQMRHLEPLRAARAAGSSWVTADRGALLTEMEMRLERRHRHVRTAEESIGWTDDPQTLDKAADRLCWGDLLTMLVLDDALRDASVVSELFVQIAADQKDSGSEYGGALSERSQAPRARLEAVGSEGGGRFVALVYPPRATERRRDREFVASTEMIGQSGRSLAHYHFHVQSWRNEEYAGPGQGDREYAREQGRSCLVFTGVRENIVNVDYYQRNGAVVDLGELTLK